MVRQNNVLVCKRAWNMCVKGTRWSSHGPDRLARSTLHLCQIADELERKGVHLQVIDQHIDTNDATGRLLFNMLSAIAQFETELRAERQLDGIQKAKERGVRFGQQKKLADAQIVLNF